MSPSSKPGSPLARCPWVLAGIVLATLPDACSTARKAGPVIAMSFARIGDIMTVPLQSLGYTVKAQITAVDSSQYTYHTRWGNTVVHHHDTPRSLRYYLTGYSLYPFTPFTTCAYDAMTQACHEALTGPSPYRRRRVRY